MLTRNESELQNRDLDKYNLQKEVLESLFTVPERVEELPKRIIRPTEARRRRAFGSLVTEPLRDRTTENRKIAKPKVTTDGKHVLNMLLTNAILHKSGVLDRDLRLFLVFCSSGILVIQSYVLNLF